jgi:hypothetical protein
MFDEQLPAHRPRRLFRISLRASLAIVFLAAVGLGWVERQAEVQRDAARAIGRAGGGVLYDWQFRGGAPDYDGEPDAPRWLIDRLGPDYLGGVACVIACTREIDDSILIPVGRLASLRRLVLHDAAVTDAGLARLAGLGRLRFLDLSATDVGDAGLAHLGGLTNLEELYLQVTKVGDAGMAHLRGLQNLRLLYLGGAGVGDAGLEHLSGLKGLQVLNLVGTRVTDAGMAHLKALPNLQHVDLNGTRVGAAGLEYLKACPSLREVDLTPMEGDDPPHLITRAAIDAFRIARPEVKIDY